MKFNFEKNVGITLIALVVTIIVILVLAGTSVNMLTGQNGILNRATEAKRNTEDESRYIYDLAGNMWEWTTETRKNDISDSQSYEDGVLRGGSFINYGYIHAVNYRYGGTRIGRYYMHVGFRVVLYIL